MNRKTLNIVWRGEVKTKTIWKKNVKCPKAFARDCCFGVRASSKPKQESLLTGLLYRRLQTGNNKRAKEEQKWLKLEKLETRRLQILNLKY